MTDAILRSLRFGIADQFEKFSALSVRNVQKPRKECEKDGRTRLSLSLEKK